MCVRDVRIAQERPRFTARDGDVAIVDRKPRRPTGDRDRLPIRLDDLWIAGRAAELRGEMEEPAQDVVGRRVLDLDGAVSQAVVDRRAQLILDDEVDRERRGHDRKRDRGCSDEGQPCAEAHCSRSA